MGCFDYVCKIKKRKCLLPYNGSQTSISEGGTCFVTNDECKKVLECEYTGYGNAEWKDILIWDLSYKDEFFDCWDVPPEDKKAYFVCPNCAKGMERCNDFNDLYLPLNSSDIAKEKIEQIEKELEQTIKRRDNLTKYIRILKSDLKKEMKKIK